jgi:uncharacterized protein (TIGR03083 family)
MDHDESMTRAETEYHRFIESVEDLGPEDWSRATACPGWDVKAMVAHVLGMVHYFSDGEEQARQAKGAAEEAHRRSVAFIDALTELQVEERSSWTSEELVDGLRAAIPRAVAARRATTDEQRAATFHPGPPFDEEWTLGYLDLIHTRDVWMHRSDISLATGHEFVVTRDHDGVIVADVVEDWARRHGQPFSLVLTGPAGGTFIYDDGGEELRLDAVPFCRILSGRDAVSGLLSQEVPF